MDFKNSADKLHSDLAKQIISSKTLLSPFRVINESSRRTGAYQDSRYIPFYFYLGRLVEPKSMVQIGLGLGLSCSCFLKGCKTVEDLLAFQKNEEFYSPRLAIKNVKDNYKNKFEVYTSKFKDKILIDPVFVDDKLFENIDLAILDDQKMNYDQYRNWLTILWDRLNVDGLLVMDFINSNKSAGAAFKDFSKIANREPFVFKTRYGTGIVQK